MEKIFRWLLHKCITYAIQSRKKLFWYYILPILFKLDGVELLVHPRWIYDNYGVKDCIAVSCSSTKSINLKKEDCFLKIPLTIACSNRLVKEWENLEAIKQNETISGLFESEFEIERYENNINVLKFPVLGKVVSAEKEKWFVEYFKCILCMGTTKKAVVTEDMTAGLATLKKLVDKGCYEKIRAMINDWSQCDVSIGFTHGDLHAGNLMLQNGKVVLIDPDRVDFGGVQEFDLIHLLIFYYLQNNREFWANVLTAPDRLVGAKTTELIDLFGGKRALNDLIVKAYFVDRVGKETKYFNVGKSYDERIANSAAALFGGGSYE